MKSKLLIGLLVTLSMSACNPRKAVIRDELRVIEKTSKDTTQTKFVQESAGIFARILFEKQGIQRTKLSRSHWAMACDRNATVIATYVAFLKALEKQLPDELPAVVTYESMISKAGKAKIVEYNVAQTEIMMGNSIKNISLFGDPSADAEVEGVLRRLREKHGASATGKKILDSLDMEHQQGLQDQAKGIKPWESPRRPGAGGSNETVD